VETPVNDVERVGSGESTDNVRVPPLHVVLQRLKEVEGDALAIAELAASRKTRVSFAPAIARRLKRTYKNLPALGLDVVLTVSRERPHRLGDVGAVTDLV
jgi:hypothetical protein